MLGVIWVAILHIYMCVCRHSILPHAIFPGEREDDLDIYRIRCSTVVL